MAPIDLKLGQNAFQVIPELSLFDVEDRKNFGFFALDHFVLAQDTFFPEYFWSQKSHYGPNTRSVISHYIMKITRITLRNQQYAH